MKIQQMLHKMFLCCNVCLQLPFVAQYCITKKQVTPGKTEAIFPYLLKCVCFVAKDAISTHTPPPPTQGASECEPCQILIVAGKWIMGSRETECSHGDGQSTVVVAMRRVLAASVCVCVCVWL